MNEIDELEARLRRLDGRGYRAYGHIRGAYRCDPILLHVEYVQGDPFASPSRFRAEIHGQDTGLPEWCRASPARRRATADFINRRLADRLKRAARRRGSGSSGDLQVLQPGQEVLERSALNVAPDGAVRARFRVGLPARGRRIRGHDAAELVATVLPEALRDSLFFSSLDAAALREHVEAVEDAVALRGLLDDRGLVAFVADGARLPRRTGIDPRPLEKGVVPFEAPDSLAVELETPNSGLLRGMGVPAGVTLIVGGGYHGKSTLLRALELGVYDHIPGDGREQVVAVDTAVKIRAEDGRRVAGTDISLFIGRLPGGEDTRRFVTDNASGSTSQAAAIVEALEVGATALLVDEDTSATNFMIRDARMQRLIPSGDEPITPYVDRARPLYDAWGVSTVAVVGGSGDYLDVADTVIAMKEYRAADVSAEARQVAGALPTERESAAGTLVRPEGRRPRPGSIDARRGKRSVSIKTRGRDRVTFGADTVELGAVEQIVEEAQTRAMAQALVWAMDEYIDGTRTMGEAIGAIMEAIGEESLAEIHPYRVGELAAFRPFELAAFLNRLRTLETVRGEE